MATPEVVFHPEASIEYGEASSWYSERDEGVARRFEREVDLGLARITEGPDRWPRYDSVHRWLLLRRFPYLLIYREHEGRIWIVAVAHGRRRPGYWKDRTVT